MSNSTLDSRLGEAFASYQPSFMSPQAWERFRDDALDLAPTYPSASLDELPTETYVTGYLKRLADSGNPETTLQNRQATLNACSRSRQAADRPRPARSGPWD